MKHSLRTVALTLLLLALVCLPAPLAFAQGSSPHAVVQVAALNVRQGPGTNYAVITVVRNGDDLVLTGSNPAGWYQVQLGDGRTGWVSGNPGFTTISGDASTLPVVAAPAAAAPVAAAAPAFTRGKGGTIVFQTSSGGAIYTVNPDGSGLRFLTNGMDPALSPDGRLVAFTRWQSSNNGASGSLWLINSNGSGERALQSEVKQPKSPTWSADSQQIVINMQQGGNVNPLRLCDGRPPWDAYDIEWPCYTIRPNPWWGLRIVNVETGAWRDLPRDIHSFAPTWNPAKSWQVVYQGDKGLVSLDLNRDATWSLSDDPANRSPVFSPDGSKLALSYHQHDHFEVHVLDLGTGAQARLTETDPQVLTDAVLKGQEARSWNNAAPAWSPDGSQIAFVTDRTGRWEIWVMNADGSKPHPLLSAKALSNIPALQYNGVDERMISWR